jgi:hypothetical protein
VVVDGWRTLVGCSLLSRFIKFDEACDFLTKNVALIGSILVSGLAIAVTAFLILRSNKRRAAVGRRSVLIWIYI